MKQKTVKLLTRQERLDDLLKYFFQQAVEDPIDGTPFDSDVMEAIDNLKRKYEGQ
jgi:hypothetical protein